jgi:uncharacterized protein (DUF169 family)
MKTDIEDTIRSYLGMKHDLVGVKFLDEDVEGESLPKPAKFCPFNPQILRGGTYIIRKDDLDCITGELVMGLRQSKYAPVEPSIKKEIKAVRLGPVEDADVVLFLVNADQAMNLSILLVGISAEFKGEVAICGETVAKVYLEQQPNLSMLCNGARMFGGFSKNDMVVGMPYSVMLDLAEKIKALTKSGGALCGCQVTDIPSDIIRSFQEIGFKKGTDYFFGKIKGYNIRVYLNKDAQGKFNLITLYLPVKGELKAEVKEPFKTKKRGDWTDIYTVLNPQTVGINLFSSENLKEVLTLLTEKAMGVNNEQTE